MKKVAVIFAKGFEEGEALTIVDILRRAGVETYATSLEDKEVIGGHEITVITDNSIEDVKNNIGDYDMIVLPGGYDGVVSMSESDKLKSLIADFSKSDKYVAAMCAAPKLLGEMGLLENRNYTAYVGYDKKINSGNYIDKLVVADDKLITSQGPATVYLFAYKLAEVLGADAQAVKERMIYNNSFMEVE